MPHDSRVWAEARLAYPDTPRSPEAPTEVRSASELVNDPEYMRKLAHAMNNLTMADIAAVCEGVVNRSITPASEPLPEWRCNGCDRAVSQNEIDSGKEVCQCRGDFYEVLSAPTPPEPPPHTGAIGTLPQWLTVYIRQISELPDGGRTKDQRAILHLVAALDSTLPEPPEEQERCVRCEAVFEGGRSYCSDACREANMGGRKPAPIQREEVCRHCGWLREAHHTAALLCPAASEMNTRFASTPLERNA